eukprot:CCRYP_000950-RA/>CCRYP_000950-RA protein AED:0.09 eAED:0.09 QI:0/-1/0/1/-1/1/1/0/412
MSTSSSCIAQEARSLHLFTTTPLLHSLPLSNLCAPHRIYLKLDCLQPSGSFKDRGMAHLCTTVRKVYAANARQLHNDEGTTTTMTTKFISSSGGNAGLAVATVARNLPHTTVEVVVPQTTKPIVIEKLKALGANVTVFGKVWNEADQLARRMVKESEPVNGSDGDNTLSPSPASAAVAVYVSPYDNPLLWTGHSTVVDEIITQLMELQHISPPSNPTKIGAILASVGGGGLLSGILEGIERNYYGADKARANAVRGIKVLACETEGAASFAASWEASTLDAAREKQDVKLIRLDIITSVATSLGALEVTSAVIQRSHRHRQRGKESQDGDDVLSTVCTDKEAVEACLKFASDHRILVEPACGAALAPLYSDRLREKLMREMGEEERVIVVEVCGGSGVSLELLEGWKQEFLM